MAQYKAGLRGAGVKSPQVTAGAVSSAREYRKVPEERLLCRLGLAPYDKEAPLDDAVREVSEVKVLLSQHIGAPAAACVAVGDRVKSGDVIGRAAEGLSVNIHASIDGTVTETGDQYVCVRQG